MPVRSRVPYVPLIELPETVAEAATRGRTPSDRVRDRLLPERVPVAVSAWKQLPVKTTVPLTLSPDWENEAAKDPPNPGFAVLLHVPDQFPPTDQFPPACPQAATLATAAKSTPRRRVGHRCTTSTSPG